ncbi:MAG: DUF3883 domain-containing protein [Spirulina sp.]
MFPKYKEIQTPLLQELIRRGGASKPSEINENGQTIPEALADHFHLSEEERNAQYYEAYHKKMRSKWYNMIQWARNDLFKKGFISNEHRGIWRITELGIKFVNESESESIGKEILGDSTIVTPQEFSKKQKEAAELGEQGENFVFEYEKKLLIKHKLKHLAERVKWIARDNVAAGYDVLSFDLYGREKYIEVKTSKLNILGFYLTENELNTAKKLGSAYWIYKVVDIKNKPKIVLEIQNPAEKILQDRLILQPISYRVTIGENLE